MATYNKFNQFTEDYGNAVHNFTTHTLKVMLTLTAPVATNSVKADLTEIAAGGGYTAGGNTAAFSSYQETSGTSKLLLSDPATWTGTGGGFGPFRYAVLYNDTPTSPADPLIAWWDYGASATVLATETFQVDLDGAAGVFTFT